MIITWIFSIALFIVKNKRRKAECFISRTPKGNEMDFEAEPEPRSWGKILNMEKKGVLKEISRIFKESIT